MIGQMAIAIALPGFSDLGRSVTPIFLLMDHSLHRLSMFSEKLKKIYLNFNFLAKCTIKFRSFWLFVDVFVISDTSYSLSDCSEN